MNKEKVAILLSTFNGEKYLKEQMDSLLNQTHDNLVVYVRDDGSTDATLALLNNYSQKSNNVAVSKDNFGNVGIAKSFRILMELANADYYFFADQDDLWELNKVEEMLKIALNSKTKNEPYLLFSNMSVFEESTKEAYDFFKKFRINEFVIKNGLFQGTISGCVMMFNERAKQLSLELNNHSNMLHDWDMLISCYLFGEIELTDKKLINHRLHEGNVIGENLKKSMLILLKDFTKFLFKSSEYRNIELKYYFDYLQSCIIDIDKKVRIDKEFLTKEEINSLGFLKRKKWYLRHFNPFVYGKIQGLLILLTV